ncbi:MAG: hypothetical protein CL844_00255, partial [Crocinitomicaceae bacterium]|nr:hypothetical protein [Crocinitomicaceae bacterium]
MLRIIFFILLFFPLKVLFSQCAVDITSSSDTIICFGDSIDLNASGGVNSTYEWWPSTGLNDTIGQNVIAAPQSTITYYVTRTCPNQGASSIDSITITVLQLPNSSAGVDLSFCSGDNVQIGVAPNSDYTYSWSPSTGLSDPSISNPLVSLTTSSSPEDFIYTLLTTDTTTGCFSLDSINLEVLDLNISTGPDIIVCSGDPINLNSSISGNGSNPVSYSWTGPNGYTSSSATPTIPNSSASMSGTYFVTATVGGCQTEDSIHITVADIDINSSLLVGGQLVYCLDLGQTNGDIFFFLSIPSFSDSITNFQIDWNNDGLYDTIFDNSNWSNPIIQNFPIGNSFFTIQMLLSNGCSVTKIYPVFVGSSPEASSLVLFPFQQNGCAPHTTNWTLTIPPANANGTNYTIDWKDGSPIFTYVQGDPIPPDWVPVPNTPGDYIVTHTFISTTCGEQANSNGIITDNAIQPVVVTENPCSFTPVPSAIAIIVIGEEPNAQFIPSNNDTLPINVCVGSPLQLTNTSNPGINVPTFSGGDCDTIAPFYWAVSPSTPGAWSVSGNLGNSFNSSNHNLWISGDVSPSITFNIPGIYTITIRVKNNCGESYFSQDFCVQDKVIPLFNLDDTIGCIPLIISANSDDTDTSMSCSPVLYQWNINYSSGYCGSTSSFSYADSTTNQSKNPVFQFNNSGIYGVSLSTINECGSETSPDQIVMVKKPPIVNINEIADGCIPYAYEPSVNVDNCADSSLLYNWSSSPSGLSSILPNPPLTIADVTGLTTIFLSVSNECGTTNDSTTFIVNPLNTITPAIDQTVCMNSPITDILIFTTGATGAQVTGLPQGITDSWSGDTLTISGTPSESGTFIYTVETTGGCPPAITTGIIDVTPLNTITAGINQTVCINSPLTDIFLFTTGATGVNVSGLPQGITYSWSGDTLIINGTPTESGTFIYTVETLGGCPSVTTTGIVEVIPLNTITSGIDQTVCMNSPITDILLFTTVATGAYVTGLPQGITDSWSGDTLTISGIPTESGTFTYIVETTGGCDLAATTGTLEVTPLNTISAGIDENVCVGSPINNIIMVTSGATGAIFSGLPAGINGTWVNNIITISGTPVNSGIYNYSVETTGGCPSSISTGTISVSPLNTIEQGINQTVCVGSNIFIILPTTGATGAYFSGLPPGVSGSWFNDTVIISGNPLISGPFNYTVETTGGCTPAISSSTITVNPDPTIDIHPLLSQSICVGGTIDQALVVSYTGGVGVATYQWQLDGVDIVGATNSTYLPPVFDTVGTSFYSVIVSLSGSGCDA